jgi:hypothetical protein
MNERTHCDTNFLCRNTLSVLRHIIFLWKGSYSWQTDKVITSVSWQLETYHLFDARSTTILFKILFFFKGAEKELTISVDPYF